LQPRAATMMPIRAQIALASVIFLMLSGQLNAEQARLTVLHSFSGSDGAAPNSKLIAVGDEFWGTTASGGLWGYGSIFRISRTGELTSVYSFLGLGDGGQPQQLVLGPDGAVYGTTVAIPRGAGLPDIWGTFFRIAPSGALTTLFVFRSIQFGYSPGPLMLAHDGNFYGWTAAGGANGRGTTFRMTTDGSLTVLHDFTQFEFAFGAFIEAEGDLYVAGSGTLRMTFGGKVASLGIYENWELIAGHDGRLYAATHASGFFCEWETMVSFLPGGGDVRYGPSEIGYSLAASLQTRDGGIFAFGNADAQNCHQSPAGIRIYRFISSGVLTFPSKFPTFSSSYLWLTESSDGQIYVASQGNAPNDFGAIFRLSPGSSRPSLGDADGDGISDLMLFDDATGRWTIDHGISPWDQPNDIPAAADYTGNGVTNPVVFRPWTGTWVGLPYPYPSPTLQWGLAGDVPVPADYDGDGRADLAVYRPWNGHWYILSSQSNRTTWIDRLWGEPADVPVPADYDGDGITDIAVYRPSTGVWYVLESGTGFHTSFQRTWGVPGDLPIVGDYDKDGKNDLAVYRPATGTWWILTSGSNYTSWITRQFGVPGDIPVAGDYDGDGIADITMFRPSTSHWFVLKSSSSFSTWDTYFWGSGGRPALGPR
jgi:uncharacterized repeat protein (TIGR03803 family)